MVLRVTQHHIEFGADAQASDIRLTEQFVFAAASNPIDSDTRVTEQFVQAAAENLASSDLRVTEQFVQASTRNLGRELTSMLGTLNSSLAGDSLILGATSGSPILPYSPIPTGQVGISDSVPGLTMMAGVPVNQSVWIPIFTSRLGTNSSVFGAWLMWGLGADVGGPVIHERTGQSNLVLTQTVEVSGAVSLSASNALALTDAVTSSITMLAATNVITATQTATQNFKFGDNVSALSLTQSATSSIKQLSASSTLTLDQDVDTNQFFKPVSQTIPLAQEAVTSLKSGIVSSTLTLTQLAESNSFGASASSTLALTHDNTISGPVNSDASSTLSGLDQDVTVEFGAYGRFAGNLMFLDHNAVNNIKNLSAFNLLTFLQVPRLVDTFEEFVSHTLSITQEATASGSIRYFADSQLVLNSTADDNIKVRAPENTLTLTHSADVAFVNTAVSVLILSHEANEGFIPLEAENTLTLNDIARSTPHEADSENTIELSQNVRQSIINASANNTLALVDTNNVQRPWYVSAESELEGFTIVFDPVTLQPEEIPFAITQEAEYQLSVANRFATTIISFATTAVGTHLFGTDHDASSTLVLTQDATSLIRPTENTIILTDEADYVLANEARTDLLFPSVNVEVYDPVTDTISIVVVPDGQFAVVRVDQAIAAISTIAVKQAAAYSLERNTTKCFYSPFVGGSEDPDAPTPPSTTLPVQSFDPTTTRFKLVVPTFGEISGGSSTADSITLKAPRFGNKEGAQKTRVNRESRGGTLIIYADPEWPEFYTLTYEFAGLKQAIAFELLRFVSDNLGLEVGVQDHEGRTWKGTILNPDEVITEDHRDSFSAMIQLEAQRDPV